MHLSEVSLKSEQVQADSHQLWRARIREWRILSVDVETAPHEDNRIFKLGAVRSDGDRALTLSTTKLAATQVVHRVEEVAAGAKILLGHNLRRHDLVELRRQYPDLQCTSLPVLDTLELSAFAFPNNPYHRLVKGYKLVSDSRNEPERDARIALELLVDELVALDEMMRSDPDWVALLHCLVRDDPPLDELFKALRRKHSPTGQDAIRSALQSFNEKCCVTGLRRATEVLSRSSPEAHEDSKALAYALGWIRVSGGNSVLPVWVMESMPAVKRHVAQLREEDCGNPSCAYCNTQHNPENLLQSYFQKPSFREKPAAADGTSLQRAIVQAGLKRESLLAVLPTGGGKSICYQLPALVHYWRSGKLTVIVSPLQSLMKDQVDNLVAAGVQCAVTINGLLTPLERRAALDKIRLGDAGIVLVSPEQFRSRSFCDAIRFRQIATWVFDEAHCLSKWGHDFRTDYLYVARYIGEHFAKQGAPIACFTATAKLDVVEDLGSHFQDSLGLTLVKFLGGHERTNLTFSVVLAQKAEKAQRIVELLQGELKDDGAAIVFCATRKNAAFFADILTKQGINCGCFHGGLASDIKKTVQQDFLNGTLSVIAATNAFGMGVDKPNIRLVIHADIPGSLENYLQEAGRAGRDGGEASCVLLFDEEDVETQFRLSATSQLRQKDFHGLLKAVKKRSDRMKSDEIVVSAKELLAESVGTNIEVDAPDATTKVTTAVAWLERSGFLKRNENRTRVFPTSLKVATLEEALQKIAKANLTAKATERYAAVSQALFRSDTPDGLSTDELMLECGIAPEDCFRILHELEKLGILANDLGLTVRVVRSGKGASQQALQDVDALEAQLLDVMCNEAPDADAGQGPQLLSIRPLCTELRRRLPQRGKQITGDSLRACIRSLSESFGSGSEKRSMLDSRPLGPDSLSVTVHRPWRRIREICELRRAVSQVVLAHLVRQIPPENREASHRIECKANDLLDAIEQDYQLKGQIREPATALEHALLYMHENKVLELDKGRSVFRSAMTIKLERTPGKSRFLKEDYKPLQDFYQERTNQTHFMHEYAKLGMNDPLQASEFVTAYFSVPRTQFTRKYFRGRSDLLTLSTTDESYKRIVADLHHPIQQGLVEAPEAGNHLILAGPGSGKTKVIVHRIAYLIRVKRVSPERIIALAFNRGAALSLKRRLVTLIGQDARGVMVLTYHAMALRLTGTSLAAADRVDRTIDFKQVLKDAVDLLEGKSDAFLDADDARDRLLQQYEYIFVDEYQDIDEMEYALVSALAGRGRQNDDDTKLSIMAVGDDDQNIYAFKGASIEFIRRFQNDYPSQITYLVENFRSSQHIISAANHLIQRAAERMKWDHPIRINMARQSDAPGGIWARRDSESHGQVRLLTAPGNANLQGQLVFAELHRLKTLDPHLTWGQVAVLARTHESVQPLRALLEGANIPYELARRDSVRGQLALMRSREGWAAKAWLGERQGSLVRLEAFRMWVEDVSRAQPENPYWTDLVSVIDELGGELEDLELPSATILDALYEASHESSQHGDDGAVKLLTAHSAKGLEFGHVLVMDCGDWRESDDDRRLLYVAMTRAKYSLTVFRIEDGRNTLLSDVSTIDGVASLLPTSRPSHRPDIQLRYLTYGPKELDIGYAGRFTSSHAVHAALASLNVGSNLVLKDRMLLTIGGVTVGRLARATQDVPRSGVTGIIKGFMVRTRSQTSPDFQSRLQTDQWEVPLLEFVEPR
ncbi:RecQ family ATP-dependent DNA helicase [Hydrogenophaga sp.]|uniref:RecQ family ATP-dependent DNA helicase n=1 Tax=Hydrogenophaga sp. TaxID=1904254 RepID=UPI003D2C462A